MAVTVLNSLDVITYVSVFQTLLVIIVKLQCAHLIIVKMVEPVYKVIVVYRVPA